MKRRSFIRGSAAGLAATFRPAFGASASPETVDVAAKLIESQVGAGRLESAVLHVVQGSFSSARSFGKAGSEDAVFLLASITKPMTAAGVMLLSDRGELRTSDRVNKFIPEFLEGDRKNITIEQLLTHTSGLPDQLPENADLRKRHAPMEEFVERAIRTPLLFDPGSRYSYQSMGILLAAEIVRRIAGEPIHRFLENELFVPLGMNRSALGLGNFAVSETVRCQTESAAPESGSGAAEARDWDWNSDYWRNFGAPWGGAHATAPDVTRFLRSFLEPTGKVLRKETCRAMIRNHTEEFGTPRGLGFALGPGFFGKSCSEKAFGHGGSTGTLAWADPETEISCVILTSLPNRVSGKLILRPVSDVVSGR